MKNIVVIFTLIFSYLVPSFADDITSTELRAGKNAMYVIHFTCSNQILAYDEIMLVFRSPVDLSHVLLAYSQKIQGGFIVNVKSDTVYVKRTGQGSTVSAGEVCDLSIATVINPDPMPEKIEYVVIVRREEQIISQQVYNESLIQMVPVNR
ncbi:hypothetical protein JW935_04200 [candidate division KSB1 bacterium]|nr:hypothetical protein [candidate division KSB1 bacterium]